MKTNYYDGKKLLEKTDLDGEKPEIYICTGNRAAGKSYYFKRFLIQQFLKNTENKFFIIFRKRDEMINSIEAFFSDIRTDDCFKYLKKFEYESKSEMAGAYQVWYFCETEMAYCTYLNAAEKIKRASARFVKTEWIFFDEMQSEIYAYVANEIDKFVSIHTSIARGGGNQSRYLPCILIGNSASVENPYFRAMGVSERFNPDAKFIRGNGWVAEFCSNESAKNALSESRFSKAFNGNKYLKYATENTFLLDYTNFVEKRKIQNATQVWRFIFEGTYIGCWYLRNENIFYFSMKNDPSQKAIAISKADHDVETLFLLVPLERLRDYFDRGGVRFENLAISNIIIENLLKIKN